MMVEKLVSPGRLYRGVFRNGGIVRGVEDDELIVVNRPVVEVCSRRYFE